MLPVSITTETTATTQTRGNRWPPTLAPPPSTRWVRSGCMKFRWSVQLPSSGYSSSSYSRPEYGSTSYLDKSEYEAYNPISYTTSKVDLNTYSPIDSPAKTQVMEDRVNTVLRYLYRTTTDLTPVFVWLSGSIPSTAQARTMEGQEPPTLLLVDWAASTVTLFRRAGATQTLTASRGQTSATSTLSDRYEGGWTSYKDTKRIVSWSKTESSVAVSDTITSPYVGVICFPFLILPAVPALSALSVSPAVLNPVWTFFTYFHFPPQ